MSSDAVKEIIAAGHDLTAVKYYGIASTVILFYDYFLTLGDEIRFIWSGKKSWVFGLFLANRYLPMSYPIWLMFVPYRQAFSQKICDRSAFFSVLTFTETTLLAQIVLTLRIYAVTRRNRTITMCFCVITISQFILGLYWTVVTAMEGAQQVLPIPFDGYKTCIFVQHKSLEIGFTTLSLSYDLLAFLFVIYTALRSHTHPQIPSLLKTIAQDATLYFLIIFTSHLVLEFTLTLGRPSIQLIPAIGNIVYLPVMITRLLLSLKKASAWQENIWSIGVPTTNTSLRFAERREYATPGDSEICTSASAGTGHEGVQSRA